jgi:tight adherence protein C
MHIYLIAGLIFVFFFIIALTVLYYTSVKKNPVRKRLKDMSVDNLAPGYDSGKVSSSLTKNVMQIVMPETEEQSSTRSWLIRAGYYAPQSVYDYYSAAILFSITLGLLGGVGAFYFDQIQTRILIAAATGLVVGALLPKLWVTRKIARRRELIRRAVPNMLDLMVVCVEAGLSVTAAVRKLSDEVGLNCRDLRDELRLLNHEMLLGKDKSEAFRGLADRTGVEELRSLAVTLIQTEKLGTSVAKSLRVLADTMRFNRRQRAEEMANKVSIKLVFPLVLLIFPELLVVLIGPAAIHLVRTLGGMVE